MSNRQAAETINGTMLDVSRQLNESLVTVMSMCSREEFEAYRRAVAGVLGEIGLEVLNPLYAEHPSLKPPDFDQESPIGAAPL